MLEVLRALTGKAGMPWEKLFALADDKRSRRGAFEKRIFLRICGIRWQSTPEPIRDSEECEVMPILNGLAPSGQNVTFVGESNQPSYQPAYEATQKLLCRIFSYAVHATAKTAIPLTVTLVRKDQTLAALVRAPYVSIHGV